MVFWAVLMRCWFHIPQQQCALLVRAIISSVCKMSIPPFSNKKKESQFSWMLKIEKCLFASRAEVHSLNNHCSAIVQAHIPPLKHNFYMIAYAISVDIIIEFFYMKSKQSISYTISSLALNQVTSWRNYK